MTTYDTKTSPMMAQWQACKERAPRAILLFRLGDFYEAFYDDALLLSKELDLTLTKRQDVPMSGVPFHTCETYIDRLVAKGHCVAIAEQIEDPKTAKGLVRREIVRIITPGTLINSSLLVEKSSNFLASLTLLGSIFGLAILDVTTADFRSMEFEDPKLLLDELCRLRPSELIVSEKCKKNYSALIEELHHYFPCCVHVKAEGHFDHQIAYDLLVKHFEVHHLDGFGLKGKIAAINAAGALIAYVKDELNLSVAHVKHLLAENHLSYMAISQATQRHLELVESLQDDNEKYTLLSHLDQTSTPMGGRLLREWLLHPLLAKEKIQERLDAIEELLQSFSSLQELRIYLKEIRDLERLIMRIETGYATPRDLIALRFSLQQIPLVVKCLSSFSSQLILENLQKITADVCTITSKIERAIVDTPPLRLSDGGIFKKGYHQELDELLALKTDSHAWIAHYQTNLRESTNIKTLKVGYTKAFGYYIEVSRGQSLRMPETFERRQTLVNAERFITPELKEYEYKVLTAEGKISALEYELFDQLRKEIALQGEKIRTIAQAIAHVDCLVSLAEVAKKYHYTKPHIDESDLLHIEEGRHPVIEAALLRESYIPNDVHLDCEKERLLIITGPNMAGKSTYIRQVALLVIMAQMGCFIPAKKAHIGIIDKVFSRIGASDDLSRGKSTFMVEMSETANILHQATQRSLVILDEIGRGTSTFDGISIAWAVAEYLLTTQGKSAKTLFATHYWELTHLEGQISGAVNYNIAVQETSHGIVFLRKIVKGGADKSYGIHVAKLAGLPLPVLKRAEEILAKLEKEGNRTPTPSRPKKDPQLQLFEKFSKDEEKILKELKQIDPNYLSPIEAHRKLVEWKNQMR